MKGPLPHLSCAPYPLGLTLPLPPGLPLPSFPTPTPISTSIPTSTHSHYHSHPPFPLLFPLPLPPPPVSRPPPPPYSVSAACGCVSARRVIRAAEMRAACEVQQSRIRQPSLGCREDRGGGGSCCHSGDRLPSGPSARQRDPHSDVT